MLLRFSFFSPSRFLMSSRLVYIDGERISRQYIQIAIFYSSTRMLKSLFFGGSGDLHFMVWEAPMYKLWLRDLLPMAPRAEKFFVLESRFFWLSHRTGDGLVRNSTPYSTYSLSSIIKWNKFTASSTAIFFFAVFNHIAAFLQGPGEEAKEEPRTINFILDGFYRLIRNDNKLF